MNKTLLQKSKEKLHAIGQEQLLKGWDKLNSEQQQILLKQIGELNLPAFKQQQQILKVQNQLQHSHLEAFKNFHHAGNSVDVAQGKELIAQGQAGCIIIAGGQGTRLKIDGPKGLCPVTPIKQKSLFQFFAEKAAAASKQAGRPLPLAIMTSPVNHDVTVRYFNENHFFGLEPEQITFFSQGVLPFLDTDGNLFLDDHGQLAQGPDGNGASLHHFVEAGIWEKWHTQGVRYVNYVLIDNALADPFDAELFGFHQRHGVDITVKCTMRRDADEKVGLLVQENGKVCVVEYSEMPDEERMAVNPDKSLKHVCANLSLFCFGMNFIKESQKVKLPLHYAFKALNGNSQIKAWKFERFIFDLLPFAQKVAALLYPRETCFAPLKNAEGPDSLVEVQKALLQQARQVLSSITGVTPPNVPLELDPQFFYPTPDLLQRWKGVAIPPYVQYVE